MGHSCPACLESLYKVAVHAKDKKYTFRDTYIIIGILEYLHTFRDLGILVFFKRFMDTCILLKNL